MDKGYSAFGLALQPSFSLPGMEPYEHAPMPSVELVLEGPEELHRAWSGARSPGPWRGRLGDGYELTIEWGVAGDLRFGYGGGAWFRLDPSGTRLGCAPEDGEAMAWQRLLLGRVLPNVSLSLAREGLHAATVEMGPEVVAIAAPSGAGKSTLTAELIRRGARLFADDFLVLDRAGGGEVFAHPGGPHLNVSAEVAADFERAELGTVLGEFAGEYWLGVRDPARQPRPVSAVALLQRGPGLRLGAEPVSPSPLILAPHMLGLPDEESAQEAKRFALYADLVESTRVLHLTAGSTDAPADLADTLEAALGCDPEPSELKAVA